jgi:acetolactate synthase-1/2/3 large subunit
MVNIVGEHATFHLRHDAPLTSDIEGIARPYSNWLRTSAAANQIGRDAAEAIVAARTQPGRIATLVVPADLAWAEGGAIASAPAIPLAPIPSADNIERAAQMMQSRSRIALLLAGDALYGKGLAAAGRISAGTGAKLLAPYPITRVERGAGRPSVERIAYVPEQAVEQLKGIQKLILVGAQAPVAYFAAPGKDAVLTSPECEIHTLAVPEEDCVGALEALSAALSLNGKAAQNEKADTPAPPTGSITLPGLATAIAAFLPENIIVVDESMTSGRGIMAATGGAPPHDFLTNTGGSIGIAMPLAVGAAVACPDHRVLCLSADGSGMYTAQALWTMARESLKVTTVVFANRAYGVLKREFSNLGIGEPGPRAQSLFDIGHPGLDWVALAKGMGVPGRRVTSLEEFGAALRNGFESGGPSLIEVPL